MVALTIAPTGLEFLAEANVTGGYPLPLDLLESWGYGPDHHHNL